METEAVSYSKHTHFRTNTSCLSCVVPKLCMSTRHSSVLSRRTSSSRSLPPAGHQLAGTTSRPLQSLKMSLLTPPTPAVAVRAADLPVPKSKGTQEPSNLPVAEHQRTQTYSLTTNLLSQRKIQGVWFSYK